MNIIITGASKGIGYETVKVFCKSKQHHVVAIARNGDALKRLAQECLAMNPQANIIPYEFDLEQFDFYGLVVDRIQNYISHCDILINNAGRLINKPFEKITSDEFDESFNVNIKGVFFFTQVILPMMKRGGHIVNISSLGGIQGSKKFPGLSAYSASKGAVSIFTEALAAELTEQEIRVNCLALGAVQTSMFEKAFPGAKSTQIPGQIAQYIADFAIQGPKYYNGKVLPVSVTLP